MAKTTTIRTTEDIIRISTASGDRDFPDDGNQYSGGQYDARSWADSLQHHDQDYKIFKGTVTTELSETDII